MVLKATETLARTLEAKGNLLTPFADGQEMEKSSCYKKNSTETESKTIDVNLPFLAQNQS